MNNIERCFLESSNTDLFHQVINDSFSFADRLIDKSDLDRIKFKEGTKNAGND